MTSEHIEVKDSKMGDRILVSALFMKTTLKNEMGEIGKKLSSVTWGQEAASYERLQEMD